MAPEILALEPAAASEPSALAGLATYRIETWGCQMNEHDSERMAGVLQSWGLRPASGERDADIILLNTCSIREKAAQKVFTRLGQLRIEKQARPHLVLGVCGCVAQQERERILSRAPYVDVVMGPRRIADLPALIAESRRRGHALGLFDPRENLIPAEAMAARVSRTRAYVTVMEGCNKNCTFCIVPLTRGREACRPPDAILREVRRCVMEGLSEIELLGQNVNAWRHAGSESWDFTRLLGAVARTPGVGRLRFTTSHPLHFKNSIIDAMASHDSISRHLHLPVQSGSNAILKRMRRGYTREEYLDRVDRLRRLMPDVALSTDIIVGFPGESDDDFEATMRLVEEIRFDSIFSFLYSSRPHTPAAEYPDDVPELEKKARLWRLQEMQADIQLERNRAWEGRTVRVLVDALAKREARQVCGRSSQNHVVTLPGGADLIGRFVDVRIERGGAHGLSGAAENSLTFVGHSDIHDGQLSVEKS
ncbi:MAG TPA: tRNA (N6-isopentenyl adenosine(37)-C2)-methylthiotransferase MiaB [Candidatus Polarisedimenticolia bacterium]|nr:tRNA (N6-isopentenyl adenosine(37)-C2)-methylthiotransferase MiaB [Candidatus Polarisedimenticolia bacterium]